MLELDALAESGPRMAEPGAFPESAAERGHQAAEHIDGTAEPNMLGFSLHDWDLQRDPVETDEEYAARRSLFEHLAEGSDRIVKRVAELTDKEIEAVMRARVPPENDYEYKDDAGAHDNETIHRGDGGGDFVRDMGYQNPDEMREKLRLPGEVKDEIERRGLAYAAAAALAGVTEGEIESIVLRRLIDNYSIDQLEGILAALRGADR